VLAGRNFFSPRAGRGPLTRPRFARAPSPARGEGIYGAHDRDPASPIACLNEAADLPDAPPCLSTGDEAGDDGRRRTPHYL
jgi:hypothetical protein